MIMGGLRLETRGDNSRQGEVSRELAVLDPPGDCTGWGGESSEGIIRERPDADALLMTALDRCLHGKDILCVLEASAPRFLSSTETSSGRCSKSMLERLSSMEIENRGRESLLWRRRFLWI